jgi:hypothetical protein
MPDQQFPIGRRIELPDHSAQPLVLESVRPLGDGFECRVRLADGTPDEAILSRDEAAAVFGQQAEAPTSVKPADADSIRLLVESARIRLAYTHDRHFAVSLLCIRTPHRGGHLQVIAYAGAGKTEAISRRVSSLNEEASSQLEGPVSPFSNTERQSRVQ